MRVAFYRRTGPAREVLQIEAQELPVPGPGEVLVRIEASGINPSDTKMRAGWRGAAMAFDRVVPHSDGAGVIVALGEGVDALRLHRRVWLYNATALYDGSRALGTAAQFCALPSAQAVDLPEQTSAQEGACFGVPACTAHRAVFSEGPVAGQTVLVQGGAGCVAHYAIQFAKLGGARVIATVSSEAKAAHAAWAGADALVNYRQEDVVERVLALTQGQGVDRIIEVDLGANLAQDVRLIKSNGHIASYSSTSVPEPTFPYYPLAYKGVNLRLVQGFNLPEAARAWAQADIARWCAAGQLRHAIAAVHPLEQIALAHEAVESGQAMGNVVLSVC
ncbi:MAG: NADPH:quinone reductase [Betaproteobacteria bacterium]|nr:NADPH:quinone reductase [Betaproteobacteria bacterium]